MSKGICGALMAIAVMLVCAPSATAAVQIGQTFTPSNTTPGGYDELQIASPGGLYTVPSAGVITRWSFQTGNSLAPQNLKLKIARPAGGADYTIVGQSPPKSPPLNALTTYTDVRIPVQADDVLGLHTGTAPSNAVATIVFGSGYLSRERAGDVPPGSTAAFDGPYQVQLDVSAVLEPDADCDGFGDETQDPEVTSCGEPAKADGTLTIDANKGKVEKGRKVTLSGQYDTPTNEACEPNRTIELQRRLKSQPDSALATFKTVQTDAAGNYSTKQKVKKTYFYRAVVGETEVCDDETSNSQKVRIQKKKAAHEA